MHFYSELLSGEIPSDVDARMVRDNNLRSKVEGSVTIALGSSTKIDAVLLLCDGVGEWRVLSGGSATAGTGYQRLLIQNAFNEDGTLPSLLNGSSVTVNVPSGGKLYEVYFLEYKFSMLDPDARPMRYARRLTDPGGSAYHSESSEVISYSGLSPGGKAIIRVGWDYLDRLEAKPKPDPDDPTKNLPGEFINVKRDELSNFEDLFIGPPLRKPFFIYPEPDTREMEAYRVYWANDFDPVPSAETLAAGYTLNVVLHET